MKFLVFIAACVLSMQVHAQNHVPSSKDIMNRAFEQAKRENKKVILIFHASWCGWCKKMDASMQDAACKKFFDDHYVTIHLTVEESKDKKDQENPGAEELKSSYHAKEAGLPFWVVLDADGNLLADSFIRKEGVGANQAGDNIGCPASDDEVAAFIKILKKTSTLQQNELDTIAKRFKENKPAPQQH
ncbi:MAG: thioredoxin family protein [Bacteroidetes bacterium]|nr:thioredoxin family protein [Bacteroidota bacterium]